MNPTEVSDAIRRRGAPSVSYSITVRLEVPAGGRAASQLTTAVEHAGGAITALDVTASGHERLRIDVTCAARRLHEQLDIPVFHDDQHGTAIVVLAALLNALRVVGKQISDVKIVISGAGAAGTAIIKLLLAAGAGDVVVADIAGVVHGGRDGLEGQLLWLAEHSNRLNFTGTFSSVVTDEELNAAYIMPSVFHADVHHTVAHAVRLAGGGPGLPPTGN